jgi:hypothetical protein
VSLRLGESSNGQASEVMVPTLWQDLLVLLKFLFVGAHKKEPEGHCFSVRLGSGGSPRWTMKCMKAMKANRRTEHSGQTEQTRDDLDVRDGIHQRVSESTEVDIE